MYDIDYVLTTDKEMEYWLNDFIEWLESRDETICGIIKPTKVEVE